MKTRTHKLLGLLIGLVLFSSSALATTCTPPCDPNDPNNPCDCDSMSSEIVD
jgi:hypothetical protein